MNIQDLVRQLFHNREEIDAAEREVRALRAKDLEMELTICRNLTEGKWIQGDMLVWVHRVGGQQSVSIERIPQLQAKEVQP